MTPIAARRRLAILDIVLEPAFPKKRVIGSASLDIRPAMKMLITIAAAVKKNPYSFIKRIEVVNTAGPVIRGSLKEKRQDCLDQLFGEGV